MKRIWCVMLAVMLVISSANPAAAAKKASLAFKKVTLQEGTKKRISIKNKNRKAVYTYTSSAKKKVSVSKKGVITAKKQGKAKITVRERLKSGAKGQNRNVGTITVTCVKKGSKKPAVTPSATAVVPAPSASAQVVVPQDTPGMTSSATGRPATPQPTETPAPTPDLYTKEIMSLHVTDKELYSVDGNTCHVDMQYFSGEASGEYFTGSTVSDGTVVRKDYKDGGTKLCSRYILSGTDADGKRCSVFIEDNGSVNEAGNIVTVPTVITDSEALSWLETADLQGRVTDHGNGEKTIEIRWNESQTEPVSPREVIRPDESQSYPDEIFTFSIDIGKTDAVKGNTGNASMIHFGASSDCANFTGKIVSDCVDTRLRYDGQIETLSARYILTGEDADGNPCSVYVENNGIDHNGMVTEPEIITDDPDLAWVEGAKLHGTVSWSPKLTIHVWAAES